MQTRKMFLKAFGFLLLAGAIVAITAIWNATRVKAFNPQPDPPAFAAIGITHEQTVRLNARVFVNDDRSTERLLPVVIEFDFGNAEGAMVMSASQTVEPGHSAFLDLNGATLPIGGDGMRAELQPSIKILSNPNGNRLQALISVEVFDNFGPDAGKTKAGGWMNHNETLVRDTRPLN